MNEASALRAAVIGCGVAGAAHAFAYGTCGSTRLVAAVDRDGERADAFAREHGVAGYASVEEMLERESPQVVSVATWPDSHPELVLRLAGAAGLRGILCEKPIALTLAEARAMVRACDRAGVGLAVNSQRIFGTPYRVAAELLEAGEIGEVLELQAWASEGGLFDWGWHWVDVLSLLSSGEPVEWVSAQLDGERSRLVGGVPTERWSLAVWQLRGGARASLECGSPIRGRPLHRVLGADGMLEVGSRPPGLATPADRWGYGPALRVMNRRSGGWRAVEVGEGSLDASHWTRSVSELADAVETGRRPVHDGERALRTLEVILAAFASARRGERVALPLEEGSPGG